MITSPITWLFPSAARLGWLTSTISNPTLSEARAIAFLFRGNGAVFTPGFGRLCDRLRAAGIWAEDLRCVGDRWMCRHLANVRAHEKCIAPVALIGHSRGGRRALAAAVQLEQIGVDVDLLVCIDVAFSPPVPANVRHAVHLFRSNWRLYPARPLRPLIVGTGRIENVDLDHPSAPFPGHGLHHLNITACPALTAWIANRVELLRP
jgi:pimeloyl-ACP methyl ester carboxylesterase